MVELVLNRRVSTITEFSLFKITYGYMPYIGLPLMVDTKFKGVKVFGQQARWNLMAAHNVIIEKHVIQAFHTNRKCCGSDKYPKLDSTKRQGQKVSAQVSRSDSEGVFIRITGIKVFSVLIEICK